MSFGKKHIQKILSQCTFNWVLQIGRGYLLGLHFTSKYRIFESSQAVLGLHIALACLHNFIFQGEKSNKTNKYAHHVQQVQLV
jgi:hypothetical protein